MPAIAYVVVLICLVTTWSANTSDLYVGRDGMLSLWLVQMQTQWGSPTWLTLLNPYQGMGSMMLPMNPWWNPAALLAAHWPDSHIGLVLSYVAYHVEFTASVVLLGRCLGFSTRYGLVSAIWLTVLLFPPFTYTFGLHSWIATSPIYAHTLSVGNAMAGVVAWLGQPGAPIRRNVALTALLLVVLAVFLAAAPLYNAGMFAGYALLLGGITIATPGLREKAWQVFALSISAASLWALGFGDFLQGIFSTSGRFASHANTSLLSYLEIQRIPRFDLAEWEASKSMLCAWGLICERFPVPDALTGSAWLHVLFVCGGVVLFFRERGRLARIGAVFAILWTGLLLYWISLTVGVLRGGPVAPLYVYLPLYPILALISLYPAKALWAAGSKLSMAWPKTAWPKMRFARSLGAVVLIGLCFVLVWKVARIDRGPLNTMGGSPLVELLRREIALAPGATFRGSVTTVLGLDERRPGARADLEVLLERVHNATGSPHALLNLWWFSIPTLDEYGQAVSLPLRAYTTKLMGRADFPMPAYFAIPARVEPEILQSLGVRFVLTDGEILSKDAALRGELPIDASSHLRLYEFRAPNLGGVSPTEIVSGKNSDEILAAIRTDPGSLRRRAFADLQPVRQLVPARFSKMTFVRGGVSVSAESPGTSALLLPLQFTNCFSLDQNSGQTASLVRANLIHSLLVFSGTVDVTLRWNFGLGTTSSCRLKDAVELRALGLAG